MLIHEDVSVIAKIYTHYHQGSSWENHKVFITAQLKSFRDQSLKKLFTEIVQKKYAPKNLKTLYFFLRHFQERISSQTLKSQLVSEDQDVLQFYLGARELMIPLTPTKLVSYFPLPKLSLLKNCERVYLQALPRFEEENHNKPEDLPHIVWQRMAEENSGDLSFRLPVS